MITKVYLSQSFFLERNGTKHSFASLLKIYKQLIIKINLLFSWAHLSQFANVMWDGVQKHGRGDRNIHKI